MPVELPGVDVVLNPRGTDVISHYPGQWIILIMDGAELLIASLDANRKDVHQAIWTSSVTLSWIFHCSFAAEILLTTLLNYIERGTSLEDLQAAVAPFVRAGVTRDSEPSELEVALDRYGRFYGPGVPGYQDLLARFGSAETTNRSPATEAP